MHTQPTCPGARTQLGVAPRGRSARLHPAAVDPRSERVHSRVGCCLSRVFSTVLWLVVRRRLGDPHASHRLRRVVPGSGWRGSASRDMYTRRCGHGGCAVRHHMAVTTVTPPFALLCWHGVRMDTHARCSPRACVHYPTQTECAGVTQKCDRTPTKYRQTCERTEPIPSPGAILVAGSGAQCIAPPPAAVG